MFLLLNNEIAFNKQILKIARPEDTTAIFEINAIGYMSKDATVFKKNDITICFYGKIKNYMNICNALQINHKILENPYEIIIDLYLVYGFEYVMQLLEGEFIIILFDNNLQHTESKLYVGGDRLGLCPLYVLKEENTCDRKIFGFSTNSKNLELNGGIYKTNYKIKQMPIGTYSYFSFPYKVLSYWKMISENIRYFIKYPKNFMNIESKFLRKTEFIKTVQSIQSSLKESIKLDMEDTCKSEPNKKIACLLSGGVDSSILTALMKDYYKNMDNSSQIYTFSVGFHGSNDLKNAKIVADYLDTIHTEIILCEDKYMKCIPKVIEILESDDIATVRYGTALFMLLKHIYENTDIRDIFTGDGVDEITGGYLNFYYIKNMIEYDYESNKLLEQYSNKGGLYVKLTRYFNMSLYRPFLNDVFLNKYMEIPLEFRFEIESVQCSHTMFDFDKALLRIAFSTEYYKNYRYMAIIPKEILTRTSEPGYDGISNYYRPTKKIIESYLPNTALFIESEESNLPSEPLDELNYYREIYQTYFPHMENILVTQPPFAYSKFKHEPTMRNLDVYLEFNLEYQDRAL